MLVLRELLWLIPHAVLAIGLVGLIQHSRFRGMPFFFSYVIFEELLFLFLFTLTLKITPGGGSNEIYQWVATGGVGISSLLQLAIFYGVVNTLILPRSPFKKTFRPLVRWAAVVTILLATGISAAFSEIGLRPLVHRFEVLNFSANLVNLTLLLVLFLFTRTFHISWKSLPAGVALGFGITSSTEMGATSIISAFGARGIVPADMVRMVGFLCCTLVWVVYIFLPESSPQFVGQGVQKSEIELWQQELHRIVK